jgi:hypothetical protein
MIWLCMVMRIGYLNFYIYIIFYVSIGLTVCYRGNTYVFVNHIPCRVVKTQDRSETFVLQGNIVIIHQTFLNSIFTTKLYILMKKINYKQR